MLKAQLLLEGVRGGVQSFPRRRARRVLRRNQGNGPHLRAAQGAEIRFRQTLLQHHTTATPLQAEQQKEPNVCLFVYGLFMV